MKKITGPRYARQHTLVLTAQTTASLAILASAATASVLYVCTDHTPILPTAILATSTLAHHLLDRTRHNLNTRAEHTHHQTPPPHKPPRKHPRTPRTPIKPKNIKSKPGRGYPSTRQRNRLSALRSRETFLRIQWTSTHLTVRLRRIGCSGVRRWTPATSHPGGSRSAVMSSGDETTDYRSVWIGRRRNRLSQRRT